MFAELRTVSRMATMIHDDIFAERGRYERARAARAQEGEEDVVFLESRAGIAARRRASAPRRVRAADNPEAGTRPTQRPKNAKGRGHICYCNKATTCMFN